MLKYADFHNCYHKSSLPGFTAVFGSYSSEKAAIAFMFTWNHAEILHS